MNFREQRNLQWVAPPVSRDASAVVWGRRQEDRIAAGEAGGGALRKGPAVAIFAGAFLGCLATLHLSASGFVPCIASALAAILLCAAVLATSTTHLFPGEFFPAIYGGTFAGMTPVLGLIDNSHDGAAMSASALFILLSIVCGVAFCIVAEIDARSSRRLALGYGGRSGTIAAAASLVFVEAAPLFGADGALNRVAPAGLFDVDLASAALTCAACTIGMAATLVVLRRRGVAGSELADRTFMAAVVALIGLIALRVASPNGTYLLDACYAGCFLGMSTPERLKGWVQPCLGAILLTALVMLVKALLPGVGGGLGLAALLTVAVLELLRGVGSWLTQDRLPRPTRGQITGVVTRTGAGSGAGPWMSRHPGLAVASVFAVLLALGSLMGPAQLASEQQALDLAAAARIAARTAPLALALVETKPANLSADAVNADLGEVRGLSLELNSSASGPGNGEVADAAAERTGATPIEGASIASAEAAPVSRQEPAGGSMPWRTARSEAISPPVPLPLERSRHRALQIVRLMGAAARPASAERRPDRPKSAAAVTASLRGATRKPATRAALVIGGDQPGGR